MKTELIGLIAGATLSVVAGLIVASAIRHAVSKPTTETAEGLGHPKNNRYTIEDAGHIPRGPYVAFLTDNATGERWVVVSGWHGGQPVIASANMKKETK